MIAATRHHSSCVALGNLGPRFRTCSGYFRRGAFYTASSARRAFLGRLAGPIGPVLPESSGDS